MSYLSPMHKLRGNKINKMKYKIKDGEKNERKFKITFMLLSLIISEENMCSYPLYIPCPYPHTFFFLVKSLFPSFFSFLFFFSKYSILLNKIVLHNSLISYMFVYFFNAIEEKWRSVPKEKTQSSKSQVNGRT